LNRFSIIGVATTTAGIRMAGTGQVGTGAAVRRGNRATAGAEAMAGTAGAVVVAAVAGTRATPGTRDTLAAIGAAVDMAAAIGAAVDTAASITDRVR
jgi:hypothetical protein